MTDIHITIEGLDEIRKRMSQYPDVWRRELRDTMSAALETIWASVPPYPRRPGSRYVRTGTLGRSLGISQAGTKMGEPSIYKITEQGMSATGEFGTNLEYAPMVIGENQAQVHRMLWWTIPGNVFFKAKPKIERLFKELGEDLARWLNK